ncbi:hypothetical protein [Xanthomonas fragariae]|uniref:hypothetical protein n=1 Tax=Xanthomonas fragariae TaxID=48664 RepID=UPI0022AA2957|nr:hypothetical protein [Xanthomonas fragariae]WAT14756.1 hypothetical protein OZ429_17720 [Xanthomonas fragariae]
MSELAQKSELIKRTLRKWSGEVPQANRLVAEDRFDFLNENDVELICDILLKELLATGLGSDFEPNKKGLELEAAIDWIRSPAGKRVI